MRETSGAKVMNCRCGLTEVTLRLHSTMPPPPEHLCPRALHGVMQVIADPRACCL
eukprot:COSAG01_NODE_48966_length_376_cov_0.935018_1_plen_54_part_01